MYCENVLIYFVILYFCYTSREICIPSSEWGCKRVSDLSAMSWSCSAGTGTPLTALSLWICWKVCLWLSKFVNTSCRIKNDHISTTALYCVHLWNLWWTCEYKSTHKQHFQNDIPCAAPAFCVWCWLSPHGPAESVCLLWKQVLPDVARLQSPPVDQVKTYPDGYASPVSTKNHTDSIKKTSLHLYRKAPRILSSIWQVHTPHDYTLLAGRQDNW